MLQYLPDNALEETVQSLNGILEFYAEQRPALQSPQSSSINGTVTGHFDAPIFPLTEE
jgi:hypothetical protein